MILVLNLGLKSIRAVVFDGEGRKRRTASRAVPTFLKTGEVEQDPDEWWTAGLGVMREVLQDRDVRRSVRAVTVTTSACNLVCVSGDGRVLRNAIIVSDTRARREAADMAETTPFKELAARRPNQRAEPSMVIPRLLWLREHEPEVFAAARWFYSSNDFLIHRLTGCVVTDPLNAEKAGYDPLTGAYAGELLRYLELPVEKLPPVQPQLSTAGVLTEQVKRLAGFGPGTGDIPVILTTYDAICAVFGSGVAGPGMACDVSGTVTSLRAAVTNPGNGPQGGLFSQFDASTGMHVVGGSNNLGGGLIEWARQCFYAGDESAYQNMEAEAAECGLGAEGLLFLPWLLGERAPLWDQDARGVFFGLERRHSRKHLIRAVLESAALAMVFLKEALEARTGPLRTMRVSGGLARLKIMASLKADILGVEVEVPAEFESTALGACLLCRLGIGSFSNIQEACSIVDVREVIRPDRVNTPKYREITAFFKDLYEACRPLYEKRRHLMTRLYDSETVCIGNL
ncbi:MAG TPA: FGGY-family carbohydrate kinase [Verrucomicrobiales bacterium]|jgi:xylulokinase|nr:FGGY-family carbohydrate kinase [Verrucomicrobiales bacterium]